MGASWFQNTHTGKSMSKAYNNACEDAREEYGHQDGYNGTITTTHGFTDLTQDFKRSKKDIHTYIDSQTERIGKRECGAICIQEPIENKNKTKSQVEHIVTHGTKKWVLKYVVYNEYNDQLIGSFSTKGDALKKARDITEKHQTSTYISMEKMLEKGDRTVAKITYKQSTTERPGKYIFFGWAAE